MKKTIVVLVNILALLMLIGVIPLFILWAVYFKHENSDSIVFLYIWLPLLLVGLPLYLCTFKFTIEKLKNYCEFFKQSIKIKAKGGKVFINTNTQTFKFKEIEIKLNDIVEFQLVNNQTIIDKSGIGESIVGGMLFGGTGAIAGAMVGKKQKVRDNYKIFIKTKNVKHAGVVLTLKVDQAYNLYETLKLLIVN